MDRSVYILLNHINMKKGILFLFIVVTVNVNAQSLKDALYGGKLKTDSGTVIRKTDDLSTKIDTSIKNPAVAEKTKLTVASKESSINNLSSLTDSTAITGTNKPETNASPKDNTKTWKEFMDAEIITLKEEVLTSKKIKNGTYYIMVDYEIGTEGQVSINTISPSPENTFLAQQIKERLTLAAPNLNPVLASNGKPRKVSKKYNFTITK